MKLNSININKIISRKKIIDNSLKKALNNILDLAYPEKWDASWLSLPLDIENNISLYKFNVICSDLPHIKKSMSNWPPYSNDPKVWIRWEPTLGNGFWIRPRKFDPILRDRFILLQPDEIVDSNENHSINQQSLTDACYFAALSGRMVWHNPSKGGANLPKSAHFQSMPVYWKDNSNIKYTFPCSNYCANDLSWVKSSNINYVLLKQGFLRNQYPVLGLVIRGPIRDIAEIVWDVIWKYDNAKACNLIIQPSNLSMYEDNIRIFIIPRNRNMPNYKVVEGLLLENEKMLMKNNRGGVWSEWTFAGVEMGLLTQVEWGPLFEDMILKPKEWGRTLLKILQKLTLKDFEEDWIDFVNIVRVTLQ